MTTNDAVAKGPGFMMTQGEMVLAAINAHPHATLQELIPFCEHLARGRMANLMWNMLHAGQITKSGRRRCRVTNRPAFTWAVVGKA